MSADRPLSERVREIAENLREPTKGLVGHTVWDEWVEDVATLHEAAVALERAASQGMEGRG